MKENPDVINTLFEIIDNQINANDPPETKITLERLIREGQDKVVAKKLIAHCLLTELNRMMKHNEVFDNDKYVRSLTNLPYETKE